MSKPTQEQLEVNAKEWREETLRHAYAGILDGDAFDYEIARLRGLEELREKKLEEARRQEEWVSFLRHPRWIAAPFIMLCIYSHFTFGLTRLPPIVLRQIIFLQPPDELTHVPVTIGLAFTAWLFGCYARRSLKDSIPALALLFDLCCLGLVVALVPHLTQWLFLQLRIFSSKISVENVAAHLGLDPSRLQWGASASLVLILV